MELPEFNDEEEWAYFGSELIGRTLEHDRTLCGLKFAIGDWLNIGVSRYGDDAALQGLPESTNYSVNTIRRCARVASLIPDERRRPDVLGFDHHDAVARLSADEQEEWLQRAEEEEMTVASLRHSLKGEEEDRPKRESVKDLRQKLDVHRLWIGDAIAYLDEYGVDALAEQGRELLNG